MAGTEGRDLRVLELPWHDDPGVLFETVRDLPYPVWLDSGEGVGGRYDIISAAPVEMRQFAAAEADRVETVLRGMLGEPAAGLDNPLPFGGGVIGYLGYELGREWMGLSPSVSASLPVAAFGVYDWAVVADRLLRRVWLVSPMRHAQTGDLWDELCTRLQGLPDCEPVEAVPGAGPERSPDRSAYRQAFERVQHYLREGDVYQVNLTRRLEASSTESARSLYRRLRGFSPAPYGAFLDYGGFQLLSNSPEQFLSLEAGRVTTRPIKGTRPRDRSPTRDAQNRADLLASEKDRAENLMIVDLLRNDLGRVCEPGSITVPQLFAVESYATVHHLVSTVSGQLRGGADAVDLLRACFPGGSITGAPKRRAMQIIDELEPVSREAYCGSVFYLGYDGRMDSSIAIRSIVRQGQSLYYWSGGGIVADSEADAEYQETLDKAVAFLQLLYQSESFSRS
jgi:para-aminobenzoate synthetase component 1